MAYTNYSFEEASLTSHSLFVMRWEGLLPFSFSSLCFPTPLVSWIGRFGGQKVYIQVRTICVACKSFSSLSLGQRVVENTFLKQPTRIIFLLYYTVTVNYNILEAKREKDASQKRNA